VCRMPRLIFFDFDGTLAESAQIKTRAFGRLFESTGHSDEVVKYHLAHAGVNRYEKFDHIYREILRQPLDEKTKKELGARFSQLVFEEILSAPLVKGTVEFLQGRMGKSKMYVVSSTPHDELVEIVRKKGLQKYFADVLGAPVKKSQSILSVMEKEKATREDCLMVGDSTEDMKEAQKAGVPFIGRIAEAASSAFPPGVKAVNDLSELEAAIEELG